MQSPSHKLLRNSTNSGGDHQPASAGGKLGASLGEVAGSTSTSTSYVMAPGAMGMFSFPGAVTDLSALAGAATSSAPFGWSSPGYDGSLGALQPGTVYLVRIASYTLPDTFDYSLASVVFSTRDTQPGAAVSTRIAGLDPNTTYYANIWACDGYGNISFLSNRATTTSLSNPVLPLEYTFLDVFDTSMTVNWGALPLTPPEASSRTAEGYILEASTTNFGAFLPGGVVYSSRTTDVRVSTLTLEGLSLDVTHYIRVGTLNWAGDINYLTLSSYNLQIATSAETLSFGTIDASVQDSKVAASPIIVRNVGTVPVTYLLSAATATTPSSPWSLGVSTGDEVVTLEALWNSVQPASDAFLVAVTTSPRTSGPPGGDYAGDQSGFSVPPGQSRAVWFKFWRPYTTITVNPQLFRATFKARFQRPSP